MTKLYSWSIWFFEQILIVLTASLAIIVIAAVFFRYVLNASLAWGDEMAGYLLVWVTFLGAVTALERGRHICFDGLLMAMPRPVRRVLQLINNVALFTFLSVLLYYGFQVSARLMNQSAVSVPIPIGVVYSVMPISGFLMLVIMVYRWFVPREFSTGHTAEVEEATK